MLLVNSGTETVGDFGGTVVVVVVLVVVFDKGVDDDEETGGGFGWKKQLIIDLNNLMKKMKSCYFSKSNYKL